MARVADFVARDLKGSSESKKRCSGTLAFVPGLMFAGVLKEHVNKMGEALRKNDLDIFV